MRKIRNKWNLIANERQRHQRRERDKQEAKSTSMKSHLKNQNNKTMGCIN